MFCPECGTKNDDDSLFCENCGKKMKDGSEKTEKIQDNEKKSAEVNNQAKQDVNTTITPRKPISKKTKMIIGLAAVVRYCNNWRSSIWRLCTGLRFRADYKA